MKELEEKILAEGIVMPGDILNVGGFLNQQMDCAFVMSLGREIARLFAESRVTKVLTVESSGIGMALAAGVSLGVPAVFAKKDRSGNVLGEVYGASAHSYTHGVDYSAILPAAYLGAEDTVLIVDDFLARGEALRALIAIVRQARARLAGAAVAVEKGFQGGGDALRRQGIRVEALALIDRFENGRVVFR